VSAVTTGGGGTAARRKAKEDAAAKAKPKVRHPAPAVTRQPPSSKPVNRRALDPDALAVLEEERTFLLGSLRDLEAEHDAGDVDEVDYDALKDDYTARAAAVIRAIDERQEALAEVKSGRTRSPGRIAAVAAGVLVVALVAGILMAQASGRRNPGDTITGDNKQDVRNLLVQAQSQFGSGDSLGAIKTYDQVLQTQPANTEALTYKGWLLYRVAAGSPSGQVTQADLDSLKQQAQQSLDAAVQADRTYPDAHIFRAIIDRDQGRNTDAASELAQVKPEQVPQLMRDTVDQLRKQVGGG
jgi:hypothetical protein